MQDEEEEEDEGFELCHDSFKVHQLTDCSFICYEHLEKIELPQKAPSEVKAEDS